MSGPRSFHDTLMQFADGDFTLNSEELARAGFVSVMDEVQVAGGTILSGPYNPADQSLLRPCDH